MCMYFSLKIIFRVAFNQLKIYAKQTQIITHYDLLIHSISRSLLPPGGHYAAGRKYIAHVEINDLMSINNINRT